MCGIAGIAGARGTHESIMGMLRDMTGAVAHRGPDDEGFFVGEGIGLGMRRLSIIDLSGGKQPIANEDGSVRVIFNGEIYNYVKLRAELEARGHAFSTRSDTEVIVHLYEEMGDGLLDRLRGMFALAVWDGRRSRLMLAVDPFGIKPLYYSASRDGLVFGSELKCLLAAGAIERELDLEALGRYFTFGYVPAPATIFQSARKLEAAHVLRWDEKRGVSVRRYWDLPRDGVERDRSPAQTADGLREALKDAVRSHLVSDVPLGVFLSGGIDSSTVVALMSEVVAEPVKTFSIGFADRAHDELDMARVVARTFGTDHHELIVEPESVDVLPQLATDLGEPFADSSALPTYFVSKMARRSVKVALSGDGGDELFIGYTLFRGLEVARLAQRIPAPVREVITRLATATPHAGVGPWADRGNTLRKRVADSMLPPVEAFYSKITPPGLADAQSFFSKDLRRQLACVDRFGPARERLSEWPSGDGHHPLEPFVYAQIRLVLAGDMLVKVDRMSMANSLEVRVPLLDTRLAEFVATVPIEQRFPRWLLKGLLKDIMSDRLPPRVLNHPKHGFSIPLSAWFRGDLAGFAREVLLDREAREGGYFDETAIERLLAKHREGRGNLGGSIWALLMFELWRREMMTEASGSRRIAAGGVA